MKLHPLFSLLLIASSTCMGMQDNSQQLIVTTLPHLLPNQPTNFIPNTFQFVGSLASKKNAVIAGTAIAGVLAAKYGAPFAREAKDKASNTLYSLDKNDWLQLGGVGSLAIIGGLLTKDKDETLLRASGRTFGMFLLATLPQVIDRMTTMKKIGDALSTSFEKRQLMDTQTFKQMEQDFEPEDPAAESKATEAQKRILNCKLSTTPEEAKDLREKETAIKTARNTARTKNSATYEKYSRLEAELEQAKINKKKALKDICTSQGELLVIDYEINNKKTKNDADALEALRRNKEKEERLITENEKTVQAAEETIKKHEPEEDSIAEEGSIAKLLKNEEALREEERVITNLINAKKTYEKALQQNRQLPSLVILNGPPGTGKTQIVDYYAKKYKEEAITYNFPKPTKTEDLGQYELFKRRLEQEAHATGKHIIAFIDEFEDIAPERASGSGNQQEKSSAFLANFLPILENKNPKIHIFAATNHYALIDMATRSRAFGNGLLDPEGPVIEFEQPFTSMANAIKNTITELYKKKYDKESENEHAQAITNFAENTSHIPQIDWRQIQWAMGAIEKKQSESDTFCNYLSEMLLPTLIETYIQARDGKNSTTQNALFCEIKNLKSTIQEQKNIIEKVRKNQNNLEVKVREHTEELEKQG